MKKALNNENNRIVTVLFILSALFISLIVYLSYFEVFSADSIQDNSYNKRLWLDEEYILRGSIYDRNDTLLAYSTQESEQQQRHYQYDALYSHIIGYSNRELGKEGLEKSYNKDLLNLSDSNSLNEIRKIMAQRDMQQRGNDMVLTLDHELQQYAQELLGNQKGSIVAMNPTNGEVYAMVSFPNFSPNNLRENWSSIMEEEDSPLLNRATQGLYTPGSIFKVITTAGALQNEGINTNFDCQGQVNIDGYVLRDYNSTAHGVVDLHQSLVESCNVAFSQIALGLGQDTLQETAQNFLFNQSIPFDLETKNAIFSTDTMTEPDLGATGIGQGKTLTTPLHMAMMTSAIANGGKIVQPTLVKEILAPDGESITTREEEVLTSALSPEIASEIKTMMIGVVNQGTGRNAQLSSIQVAGKTGTAENADEKAHAWFVGFAPADEPQIAIAVVLENNGSTGGSSAAPIARNLISKALQTIR